MSEYLYLGFEKKSYTNRNGDVVVGYNFFYAYTGEGFTGFKPAMRFDSSRKSLGYCYLSEKAFNSLGLSSIPVNSKVFLSFNQFGGVETVRLAK